MNTLQLNKKGVNGRTLNVVGLDGRSVSFPLRKPDSEPTSPYIKFADPEVKRICVENWGSDGEITYEQAAAVTGIGTIFRGNVDITRFNEFRYFTGVTAIGGVYSGSDTAFRGCTNLKEITLPSSLTRLLSNAFRGCSSLTKFDFSNITELGYAAFYECTNLVIEELSIPNLTSLGYFAFSGTPIKKVVNLGKLTVLPSGNSPSNFTYGDEKTLEMIIFPEGIVEIPVFCCYSYDNLRTVVLPTTISQIQSRAFSGVLSANLILKAITPPQIASDIFSSVSNISAIYVPDDGTGEIVEAYKTATNWSTYASRIFPISQLEVDNEELFNEIYEYIKDIL